MFSNRVSRPRLPRSGSVDRRPARFRDGGRPRGHIERIDRGALAASLESFGRSARPDPS